MLLVEAHPSRSTAPNNHNYVSTQAPPSTRRDTDTTLRSSTVLVAGTKRSEFTSQPTWHPDSLAAMTRGGVGGLPCMRVLAEHHHDSASLLLRALSTQGGTSAFPAGWQLVRYGQLSLRDCAKTRASGVGRDLMRRVCPLAISLGDAGSSSLSHGQ